jgi:hypothetical protein
MLKHHPNVSLLLLGFLELNCISRGKVHKRDLDRIVARRLRSDLGRSRLHLGGIVRTDIVVVLCVLEVCGRCYLLLETSTVVSG